MVNEENSSSVLENGINGSISNDSNLRILGDLHSYTERLMLAMLCLLICIFGTLGNSSVFIAVLLSRKLQTPTNAFVVSLAITDFITSLLLVWYSVTFLNLHGWPLPDAKWLCTIIGYMTINNFGVTLVNLAAISMNRYILITKPLKTYQKIYTPVNIGLMVAATWIIPLLTFLPLAGIARFGYNKKFFACSDNPDPEDQFTFILVQVVFILVVLTIVITCYTLVFRHVRRHSKKMRQQLNNAASSMQASSSRATTEQQTQSTTADTIPGPGTSGESSRR